MKFPNRIPDLAKTLGFSQTYVRLKAGYKSHSHFNAIWNGKRQASLDGMNRIAKVLGEPISKIFFL